MNLIRARSSYTVQAGDDLPPPALDAAVLAAAHRAAATRPRLAGAPFSRTWRITLSMAAVLVLSVSLVTLMREHAPEAVQPRPDDFSRRAEKHVPGAAEPSGPASATLADSQKSSSLGLKPSLSSSSGLGLRSSADLVTPGKLRLESTTADRSAPALRAAPSSPSSTPEAFPDASNMREKRINSSSGQAPQNAREETRRDMAAGAERPHAPAIAQAAPRGLSKLETGNSMRESDLSQVPGAVKPQVTNTAPATSEAADGRISPKRDTKDARGLQGQSPPAPAEARPSAVASPPSAVAAAAPASPGDRTSASIAETVRAHAELSPELWLARIELARRQGRLDEARASLIEFRKRFPAHAVPASLSDGISQ